MWPIRTDMSSKYEILTRFQRPDIKNNIKCLINNSCTDYMLSNNLDILG